MSAGIFFALPSIWSMILNGAVGGAVVRMAVDQDSSTISILISIPHAVFELPAFFISMGLGVFLGLTWFGGDIKKRMIDNLVQAHSVFVLVVIPLLITGALIEAVVITIIRS